MVHQPSWGVQWTTIPNPEIKALVSRTVLLSEIRSRPGACVYDSVAAFGGDAAEMIWRAEAGLMEVNLVHGGGKRETHGHAHHEAWTSDVRQHDDQ